MDVTQSEVEKVMKDNQVDLMIHGHTHRPNVHRFTNADNQEQTRIVLGDWYTQGSVLVVTQEGFELQSREFSNRFHNWTRYFIRFIMMRQTFYDCIW